MTEVHVAGFLVAAATVAVYALSGAYLAATNRASRWADWASAAAVLTMAGQAATGTLSAIVGAGPSELTHWIYGPAVIVVLLVATGYVAGCPPRQRGLVTLGTGFLLALLLGRLVATA